MQKKIIEHDGQYYNEGEPIWDLGSFECVGFDGNQRYYEGFSADAPDKLPKYDNLGAGSTATCLDNGDFYKYHAKSKEWIPQV